MLRGPCVAVLTSEAREMSVPDKFKGYASFSKDAPTALKLHEFTPKKFEEHDIDIKITHCGVFSVFMFDDPLLTTLYCRSVEAISIQ